MPLLTWVAAAGVSIGALLGLRGAPARLWLVLLAWGLFTMRQRSRSALFLGVVLASTAAGGLSAVSHQGSSPLLASLASDVATCELTGKVLEHVGSLGTLVRVESVTCLGAPQTVGETAIADGRLGGPGGAISGEARFLPLGRGPFHDARRRAGAAAVIEGVSLTATEPRDGWFGVAASLRRGITSAADVLAPEKAALLTGLSIGDTSKMDAGLEEAFRRSGLSHLVAVSGSNVAIVLGAVVAVAWPLGRAGRSILGLIALVLFVLVVGPEPSVLRAAAMGTLSLMAVVSGRRAEPIGALALAVIAVVTFRPQLVHSVGLHLSVAASAGLILWAMTLADRLPGPRIAALALGVTLAAQIAVAPVLIAVFGEISVVSPIANLLAAPAVAPATIIGFSAGLLAAVAPAPAEVLVRCADPAVAWIVWVGRTFGGPQWASIELPTYAAVVLTVPLAWAARRSMKDRTAVPLDP